jgi:cysteinyl-tRNA synthetase
MSKSLGNLVLVRDLLKNHNPDALRLYLAGTHYRNSWEHDERKLEEAEDLAVKLSRAARAAPGGKKGVLNPGHQLASFFEAMDNDLGTPLALRAMDELAGEILEEQRRGRKIGAAVKALRKLGSIFGLRMDREELDPEVFTVWEKHRRRFAGSPV